MYSISKLLKKILQILNKNGRGNVFDIFFKNYNEKRIIDRFVRVEINFFNSKFRYNSNRCLEFVNQERYLSYALVFLSDNI